MLKAIIFDFDYTLGDSSNGIAMSINYGVSVDDMFCGCKVMDVLPEDKREEFNHNVWLNRIANRAYCW